MIDALQDTSSSSSHTFNYVEQATQARSTLTVASLQVSGSAENKCSLRTFWLFVLLLAGTDRCLSRLYCVCLVCVSKLS